MEDEKRLYEIIARLKSRLQVRLTSAGHTTAATRAMGYFSPVSSFNDRVGGIDFYKVVEHLEEHFQEEKEELVCKLKSLMKKLFCKERMMVSLTSEDMILDQVKEKITELTEKLESGKKAEKLQNLQLPCEKEGFLTASQVQYVAVAGNFREVGFEYTGALRILKTIMGYEYLWMNIRVQGGAYGCMSGFGRSGDSYFVSYRDPNLGRTVEVYKGIAEYLKNFEVDDRDMCKYIIGTISEMDTPMNPLAKGNRSLAAWLGGLNQEMIQRERDEVLGADAGKIRELSAMVDAIMKQGYLCVIGSEDKIQEEKSLFTQIKPLIG